VWNTTCALTRNHIRRTQLTKVDMNEGNGISFLDMPQKRISEIMEQKCPKMMLSPRTDRAKKRCSKPCWRSKRTVSNIPPPNLNGGFCAFARSVTGPALPPLLRPSRENAQKSRTEGIKRGFLAGQGIDSTLGDRARQRNLPETPQQVIMVWRSTRA
jgi:hypothetical protein